MNSIDAVLGPSIFSLFAPVARIDGGGDIPQRGRKTLYTRWKGVGCRYMPHQGAREMARASRRAGTGGAR
jgi:hypothetical protein